MTAYYNEHDPYAAQWLRNLISAGHIAPGDVDERSIEDVRPDDLRGYGRCHFFAGIGVWDYALSRAGWPLMDKPVWTGSCPCQPFSAAGKGAGFADERHLWPAWLHLIQERRPPVLFGEQVAGRNGLAWLDLVQADLEGLDYAVGAVPAPAAGFGAPHIRERLYWVAYADDARPQGRLGAELSECAGQRSPGSRGSSSGLGDPESDGRERRTDDGDQGRRECAPGQAGAPLGLEHTTCDGREQRRPEPSGRSIAGGCGADVERPGPTNGFWRHVDWLLCRDGKWRPVEPGTRPLAHGVANRVGKLRAYGNTISAPEAEVFIEAVMAYRP